MPKGGKYSTILVNLATQRCDCFITMITAMGSSCFNVKMSPQCYDKNGVLHADAENTMVQHFIRDKHRMRRFVGV